MPGGKFLLRPSSARSPSVTSMITAGSVRGKCIALQSGLVQRRMCPASSERVGLPQRPQKRCRECHHTIARANASNAPSWRANLPASWRRSAKRAAVGRNAARRQRRRSEHVERRFDVRQIDREMRLLLDHAEKDAGGPRRDVHRGALRPATASHCRRSARSRAARRRRCRRPGSATATPERIATRHGSLGRGSNPCLGA